MPRVTSTGAMTGPSCAGKGGAVRVPGDVCVEEVEIAVARTTVRLLRATGLEAAVDVSALLGADPVAEPPYWMHLWPGRIGVGATAGLGTGDRRRCPPSRAGVRHGTAGGGVGDAWRAGGGGGLARRAAGGWRGGAPRPTGGRSTLPADGLGSTGVARRGSTSASVPTSRTTAAPRRRLAEALCAPVGAGRHGLAGRLGKHASGASRRRACAAVGFEVRTWQAREWEEGRAGVGAGRRGAGAR